MPRRNRYHLPGLIYHITHRCHNREWLFSNRWTRNRYRYWLFEARKRYGISIINYVNPSNHVHLLVYDHGVDGVIESAMQLTQGRIAQEYNQWKGRTGSFWQDRYHATAVESGKHLRNCFLYIDRNMMRAGVVKNPWSWEHSGASEFRRERKRYQFLDERCMLKMLGFAHLDEFIRWQEDSFSDQIHSLTGRESQWTESVAVGGRAYVEQVADRLALRLRGRKLIEKDDQAWVLEEGPSPYNSNKWPFPVF
jgi:putative transposase